MALRIGVDLMGSDSSPQELFTAVIQVAQHPGDYLAIATQAVIDELIQMFSIPSSIAFHPVSEEITMDDDPLTSIRRKKQSSLVVGVDLLGRKELDAFVTAGNTGALLASSSLMLPKLPGINRPGLLAVLPTEKEPVAVIDVGGNVVCKAEHLLHFARMGVAYQHCVGVKKPKVALLNIGIESKKGTPEIREAYQQLLENRIPSMEFVGNVEGREVFQGKADVLVTDGFTGNVLLKTSEGVSSLIFEHLQRVFADESSEQVHRALNTVQHHFDYAEYPGAIVCGVEGVVVKCHGESPSRAMENGVLGAMRLVQRDFLVQMKKLLR